MALEMRAGNEYHTALAIHMVICEHMGRTGKERELLWYG
jgi:hypothetical protein